MSDLAHTPQAAQAAATARAKQVADGIRANGIKQGYANRDAEWHKALGVTSMDEAREVTALRLRPTPAEEAKHVKSAKREGIIIGIVMGALLTMGVAAGLMRIGTESTVSGVAVGSQIQRQNENVRMLDALERGEQ